MNLYKGTARILSEQWYIILEAITLKAAEDSALSKISAQLNVHNTDNIELEVAELGQDQWMRENNQPELFDTDDFTLTVYCFTDKEKTAHFHALNAATSYANKLLKQKHKCKIYTYRESKSRIDYVAERGPDG